jgi:hypothetical protein
MPSSRCNKPNARSDTAPNPTAHNQPTSSRTADTTSNDRNDTAPNRCRRRARSNVGARPIRNRLC